jgi:hypothetical protein
LISRKKGRGGREEEEKGNLRMERKDSYEAGQENELKRK